MESIKYPALIRKERCGLYSVLFPDLDCAVCGETPDEAMDMARETLAAWTSRAGSPAPSDPDDVRAAAEKGETVMLLEARAGDVRFAPGEQ